MEDGTHCPLPNASKDHIIVWIEQEAPKELIIDVSPVYILCPASLFFFQSACSTSEGTISTTSDLESLIQVVISRSFCSLFLFQFLYVSVEY